MTMLFIRRIMLFILMPIDKTFFDVIYLYVFFYINAQNYDLIVIFIFVNYLKFF